MQATESPFNSIWPSTSRIDSSKAMVEEAKVEKVTTNYERKNFAPEDLAKGNLGGGS